MRSVVRCLLATVMGVALLATAGARGNHTGRVAVVAVCGGGTPPPCYSVGGDRMSSATRFVIG